MSLSKILVLTLLSSPLAVSQAAQAANGTPLPPQAALPILFTNTVSANHAHAGDIVHAKTTQIATLPNGGTIPAGTEVIGHVMAASAFTHDKTPYAKQKESTLSIHFDAIRVAGHDVPLNVTVRAMADPITSQAAQEPKSSDLDSLGTLTLIGGAQLIPSQSEVVNRDGDVVAYNKKHGVYAHLIAQAGCDGGTTEVPVGIYSPSACGLYGFSGVAARETGSSTVPSTLSLVSTHTAPTLWRNSTALLEVLPESGASH